MEKKFKYYLAVWVLLLAVFNVIAFVSVGWISFEKYTAAFWLGYGFITLSFVLNLVYGLIAFRKADATTTFYNIAYFRIGYAELILSFVVGGMFMLIPGFAWWVCTLISVIVLGANTLALIKAKAAVSLVVETDKKIADQTQFMKLMTADAQSLLSVAKDEQSRLCAQKVYEALLYSDIVSNEAVAEVEAKMTAAFAEFAGAVAKNADAQAAADQLLFLISTRNNRCKATK